MVAQRRVILGSSGQGKSCLFSRVILLTTFSGNQGADRRHSIFFQGEQQALTVLVKNAK